MKELKIYLEIMGLAEDENGNPDAAGQRKIERVIV